MRTRSHYVRMYDVFVCDFSDRFGAQCSRAVFLEDSMLNVAVVVYCLFNVNPTSLGSISSYPFFVVVCGLIN